ncbi:YgeY family selenium metabolism-linked hydrolase [Mameliella alba]|uniref:YgeY family selenium metabolism-linked hydrolase n=1 Tax=Mameliella alba TaxID=561184 RepID=UPI001C937920|nr:YgeY family selenium metabolism-linked hydrolase [Mameliella alba]MBY6120398.1 YgeY family selenium metabolism-linked hydrolase [Mameliella alba]
MQNRNAAEAGAKSLVVEICRELISVGATSGDEGPVADIVERRMQELGYRDIRRDRLGNVTGRVGPQGANTALLFDSHMDVVAVTGDWSVDPFGGEIRDGRLYGRGATDMKGALAASLCGVADAARKGDLTGEVVVSASVMEETVEGRALSMVLDEANPDLAVICEPSSLQIKTGQRGRMEIIVEALGRPAHAAHPERGRNAIELAAKALAVIANMKLADDPDLGSMIMVPTDIISDPYPLVSALPASVAIRFDRRIGVADTKEKVLGELEKALAEVEPDGFRVYLNNNPIRTYTGETLDCERFLAAWSNGPQSELAQAAADSLVEAGLPVDFGYYAFCTNGSETAGMRQIPTIGLGPGNESDAHIVDESVSIEELTKAVEVYRNLTLRIAGGQNANE